MTDIQSILTHRYPFLMIDRILDIELGKLARGYKNITWNEWFFTDSCKVMPSMMIVEALAQLGAFASSGKENGLGFLTSLKGIEFLGNAHPGDRLDLFYEVVKIKKGFVLGRAQASVEEQVIVTVEEIMIYINPLS